VYARSGTGPWLKSEIAVGSDLVRITFSAVLALVAVATGAITVWLAAEGIDYLRDAPPQDAPIYSWIEGGLRLLGALITFWFAIGSAVCALLTSRVVRRTSRDR
jgi:uncharacterized membrane protein (DUF441 family)